MGEAGGQQAEQWFQHLGVQFMECWSEIASFDVQMYPSPSAPNLGELQGMFQGLNMNTPVVTTSFRVSAPGLPQTARIVLGIPQAYLLAYNQSLFAIGETTLAQNDTSLFYERLAYIEEVPVPVSVKLGQVELTVGELQSLEEGDVIELNTMLGDPLKVQVGSFSLLGKPGTAADGRRLAVQIVMG
jgi:flagellar motor switch protein FliN/FliY